MPPASIACGSRRPSSKTAAIGVAAQATIGPGYVAAATAVVMAAGLLVLLDLVHPPDVSTALSVAFRNDTTGFLELFALAAGLVAVQQVSVRVLHRHGVPAGGSA